MLVEEQRNELSEDAGTHSLMMKRDGEIMNMADHLVHDDVEVLERELLAEVMGKVSADGQAKRVQRLVGRDALTKENAVIHKLLHIWQKGGLHICRNEVAGSDEHVLTRPSCEQRRATVYRRALTLRCCDVSTGRSLKTRTMI